MKKALQCAARWLVNLFFAAALLLAAAVWLPKAFHMKAYVVKSSSMEPAISAGSVVYVSQYKPQEPISPGDIICFQTGEAMVTHRIVSIDLEEGTAITKGDGNQVSDPKPLLLEDIQGKVRFHIPGIGYLLLR